MPPVSDMLFYKLTYFVLEAHVFPKTRDFPLISCATTKTHALKIEFFDLLCSSGKKKTFWRKLEGGVAMSWLFSLVGLSSCSVSGFLSVLLVQRTFL